MSRARRPARPGRLPHTVKIKTIQFRPKTDDHDYQFKKKHIISFLEAGNKVKVVMRFRGREITHLDLALEFLEHLNEELKEYGSPESRPRAGRSSDQFRHRSQQGPLSSRLRAGFARAMDRCEGSAGGNQDGRAVRPSASLKSERQEHG